MNNSKLYEQSKEALHELNSKTFLPLGEYSPEVEDVLIRLGARRAQGEIRRSPETRSAELGKEIDKKIEAEQRFLRADKYSRRADIRSTISLIVACISMLIALLSILLKIC